MHKAIIFTNNSGGIPAILIEATLEALRARTDIKVVAVCVPKEQFHAGSLWHRITRKLPMEVNPGTLQTHMRRQILLQPLNLKKLAHQQCFEIITPADDDINNQEFINRLHIEFKPTVALSYYCPQKFGADLLALFSHAVNYHNGLLPAYRGLKATSWSIYNNEEQSGFTFHRMTSGLDEGPVLLEGVVFVRPDISAAELDLNKAMAAAKLIPTVLQMAVSGDAGRLQSGKAGYFSRNDWESLTKIHDPSNFTSNELTRRMRAFDGLQLKINGRWQRVTRIRELKAGHAGNRSYSFRTADNALFVPVKRMRVPFAIWWVIMWLMQWLPSRIRW